MLLCQMFSALDLIRRPRTFEVASDKASLYLHRFARVVADTWLGDYKMGYETDLRDSNIYSRKVATLAMMVSTSLSKIGYPSEHVSAAKVSGLIKKMVKQSRWRMKNDRGVKPDDGADANNGIYSTSKQDLCVDNDDDGTGQPRTKSFPQSRVYHDGDSNDEDEDYRAEDSILSGPSNSDCEEVPWSKRKSAYSAPAANKGRKTTAVNRHDNDREDEVPTTQRGSSSSAPAPANKRQKTAAASKDAIPTSSASSVATADNGSKQKPTPATAAVTTASRRKKTA
jgi:hypothetical protein